MEGQLVKVLEIAFFLFSTLTFVSTYPQRSDRTSMDSELKETLTTLSRRLADLTDLMRELIGQNQNARPAFFQRDDQNEFDLISEIEDMDNFDCILETMNQYGNSAGFAFKRGQSYSTTAKSIICKYYDRNKSKNTKNEQASPEAKPENRKQLIKDVDCKVYYRFSVNADDRVILTKFYQIHNHLPCVYARGELTTPIKLYMVGRYRKTDKVCDVRDSLESIFGLKLDYWRVYREFRSLYPRLGANDVRVFLEFLNSNNALHYEIIDSQTQAACRLYFQTRLMHEHYDKFGDIMLIDSTYNTNQYSIPLVIISGLDNNFRNVLFALALVNDEKKETFSWIFNCFLKENRKPRLIITDGDKALCSVISSEFKDINHRICCWHMCRNLRKNFNFLKAEDQEIKDKIFSLPLLPDGIKFELAVNEILKYLTEQNLTKSKDYLDEILTYKHKWAVSQHVIAFDAGIITTSRAESTNSVVKKYLNSRSELDDLRKFILDFETKYFTTKDDGKIDSAMENIPLAKEFKAFLSPKGYAKQVSQLKDAMSYENDREELDDKSIEQYKVINSNLELVAPKNVHRVLCGAKLSCDCPYFQKIGLVCRHILHICYFKKIKTLEKLIVLDRWRNTLAETETAHFLPFLFTSSNLARLEERKGERENQLNEGEMQIEVSKEKDNPICQPPSPENRNWSLEIENFEKKEDNKGAPKKGNDYLLFSFFIRIGTKKRKISQISQNNQVTETTKTIQALQEEVKDLRIQLKKVHLTQQEPKEGGKKEETEEEEKFTARKTKKPVTNTRKKK